MHLTRLPETLLIAVVALATGCASSGITTDAEAPVVPESWVRDAGNAPVTADWVASFSDARLSAFIDEAVDNNYVLKQEQQRLVAAREAVVVTRSGRFPVLNLSVDASRRESENASGIDVTTDTYDASLGGSWDVDLWRELSKRQQAAELALAAQEARLQSVERDIAGATASQYFDVLQAQQLLEVAERRLDNVIQSEEIVASGYRLGLNDALDLYLARNQVERERANLAEQEQLLLEAATDLQLSLARYPDGLLSLAGQLPVIDEPVPAGLPSDLLTRRPDIQEAWLNLLAADADLAAAHKARFPSLSLVGSTGVTSSEFANLLDGGASGWSLALGLTQPLFDAGRLAALEAQALARVRIAEQAYLDLMYRAFADVENSIAREASLAARYESLLDAERNARAALELALEQYQRGLVTYTTVLESQQQAFSAEATVVQLSNQRLQNRINLFLALGGQFSPGN